MENIFYLAEIFGSIKIISVIILIIALGVIMGIGIAHFVEGDYWDNNEKARFSKFFKCSIITCIISVLVCIFVPSQKTYYLMKGSAVIEDLAKNDKVQETAGKTLDLLNQYLDEKLENKD